MKRNNEIFQKLKLEHALLYEAAWIFEKKHPGWFKRMSSVIGELLEKNAPASEAFAVLAKETSDFQKGSKPESEPDPVYLPVES